MLMRAALFVALVILPIGRLAPVAAQAPSPLRAPGAAPTRASLDVDVRSRAAKPGEILVIDVRTPVATPTITATLGDRTVPLWRVSTRAWRGLAGLDVEQAPGPLALAVVATPPQGPPLSRTLSLEVQPATFAERHLTVPPRFVDPPESERPRIEREAIRLRAIYDAVSTDLDPGVFVAPVPHRRSSPFGSRSVFNGQGRDRHAGLDFASPAGAIIRAPAAGRVVLVDPLYFTGNTVVIDHGRGLYSILAHLQRTLVGDGQIVARGDRLGTVGATGRATGPHLHWSVRLGSIRVDPASVLAVLGATGGDRKRP
jgi:murein DD-endopeptidase MepM/ murein hydrolase activator NlpD